MSGTVFVAGASGAVGRRLCRLLADEGWPVIGTTRSANKTSMLRELGVEPVVVDVFDAAALLDIVLKAKPEIVFINLLTFHPGSTLRKWLRLWSATRVFVRSERAT